MTKAKIKLKLEVSKRVEDSVSDERKCLQT